MYVFINEKIMKIMNGFIIALNYVYNRKYNHARTFIYSILKFNQQIIIFSNMEATPSDL